MSKSYGYFRFVIYLSSIILNTMSCVAEISKGLIITNPAANPTGTTTDLSTLFTANAAKLFDELTVFNDTDRPVRVSWTNSSTGNVDFFFVPNGGKAFTHKLNIGSITNVSFNVSSWDNTLATGRVTINFASNHS